MLLSRTIWFTGFALPRDADNPSSSYFNSDCVAAVNPFEVLNTFDELLGANEVYSNRSLDPCFQRKSYMVEVYLFDRCDGLHASLLKGINLLFARCDPELLWGWSRCEHRERVDRVG